MQPREKDRDRPSSGGGRAAALSGSFELSLVCGEFVHGLSALPASRDTIPATRCRMKGGLVRQSRDA